MLDSENTNHVGQSQQTELIRVFVGSMPEQALATKVLEFSVRKATAAQVSVKPLYESSLPIPKPRDPQNQPRTPFSFQRFLIPSLCNFRGRAIYVDSDMMVFRDIREIWNHPMGDADLLTVRAQDPNDRRPQFSVMVMDNEKLVWQINDIVQQLDSGHLSYEDLMYRMKVANKIDQALAPEWNSLEQFIEGKTALLHFTDMQTQPWISTRNKHGEIWCSHLLEAVEQGLISKDEIKEQIAKGWIRPSLLYQVENRVSDPTKIPVDVLEGDKQFSPLFKKFDQSGSRPTSLSLLHRLKRWLVGKTQDFT